MKQNGNRYIRSWLSLCLFLLAPVFLRAQTATGSGSYNGFSYEGSISATSSGSSVNFVYSMTITGSQLAGVYIYTVNSSGAPVSDPLFYDRQSSSFSGTYSVDLPLVAPAVGLKMFVYGQDTSVDPSGSNNKIGAIVDVNLVPVAQTVSVNPSSQSVQLGNAALLAANGALGGNSYVWTSSGGTLTPNGDEASFVSSVAGNYTISVYASAGAGYEQSNTATATVNVTVGLPQTVSVSPSSGSVAVGSTTTLAAAGGQNGYSWSLSAGGIISYNGASAVVSWNSPGTHTVKVWSPAGGGYDRSNEATAVFVVEGQPSSGKRVTLTFDNRQRNYAVDFVVYQDGKQVAVVNVPAGDVLIKTISVPSSSPVTVTARLNDLFSDVYNEVTAVEEVVGTYEPTDTSSGATPPNQTAEPPPPSEPQPLPDDPPEQSEENPMGSPTLPSVVSAVNKALVSAAVNAASSAGGKGREEGNKLVSQFGSVPSRSIAPVPVVDNSSISLGTHGGKSLSVPRNPFSSSGPFGGVMNQSAAFIKRMISWGIVVAFLVYVVGEIRGMVAAPFMTAPFGSSLSDSINSVKVVGNGGGFGYAVRLLAFVAILAIMLVMPLAVTATVTSGLPWQDLVSVFSAGPASSMGADGMLADAIALANQVVPWAMLIVAPAWYAFVRFVIFPSQLFWMFFIKFLPI